jgi:DNA polymerase I-like protein with 3'-5' exonuclease and polymerase domains
MPAGDVLSGAGLHYVNSLAQLDECRRWIGSRLDGTLCVDTESAGLEVHKHPHRLTQIGDKRHGWSFPPPWFGAVNELLASYPGRIGMFNSPYDHRVLDIWDGLVLDWSRIDDAQLAGHIHDSSVRRTSLKARAAADVDPRALAGDKALSEAMAAHGWNWATVPVDLPQYWAYGAVDPVITSWLLDVYSPAVRAAPAAYDLELRYAALAASMMKAGLLTDRVYISEWISRISAWTAQAGAWLRDEHSISSVRSHDQVVPAMELAGVVPSSFTEGGKPSIDKDTLRLYAARFPQAAPLLHIILNTRKGEDVVGRYLAKFLELADATGVMHYSIHTVGAARTGRSSVTDPAMQTFDRDFAAVRGSFIPRPGHVLISWDAAQIEARMMAHFSRDPRMIADFLEADASGGHFFLTMASKIYGQQISKKDPRYTMTKNATYAQFYGSGPETTAATAGVSVAEIRPVYDGLRQLYPRVGAYMDRIVRDNKNRKGRRPHIVTPYGRILYGDRGREYALVDYAVQGSAAEFLKAGAVAVAAAGYGDLLRLTIHDELIAEVPTGDAQAVLRDVTEILTDRGNFAVPLPWEGTIMAKRWVKG